MKFRLIAAILLITYAAVLVRIMVFKNIPTVRVGTLVLNLGGSHNGAANLIPFRTISSYLSRGHGLLIGGINLLGNILLLVPVGLLAAVVYRSMTGTKSLLIAVACGLVIEGLQVVLQVGIFDVDDVILNAFGFIIGYLISRRLMFRRTRTIAGVEIAPPLPST